MSFITNVGSPTRRTFLFSKPNGTALTSGLRTDMGSAFILLDAAVTVTDYTGSCRVRFYSNSSSAVTDYTRTPTDYNINDSVALIADINLSGSNKINFNPLIIGNTFNNGEVYYNISGSADADLFESIAVTVLPIGNIGNSQVDRTALIITASSVATTGNGSSGTITTNPKSFIILSGSATVASRLRIYSRPISEVPAGEQSRTTGSLPAANALLIADLVFDTANTQYPLVPLLEAYTWDSSNRAAGNNQLGYLLQNLSGVVANISASLLIYTTED